MKYFLSGIFACLLLGCSNLRDATPVATETRVPARVDSALFLNSELEMLSSVRELYKARNGALIFADTALTSAGDSLIQFIRSSAGHGLNPSDYHLREIDSLMQLGISAGALAQVDCWLTDAFFSLRTHLKYGRLDAKSMLWKDRHKEVDKAGIKLLNSSSPFFISRSLSTQQPDDTTYLMLRDSLQALLRKAAKDSLVIGRVNSLTASLERLRLAKKLPRRHVRVNVPSFLLDVVDADTVVMESNVIVGKRKTPTPIMESLITSFIIYPYWHVPRSIATKELLPLIQKDSTYLRKHNYEVLDRTGKVVSAKSIDWSSLSEDNFGYVLRQREGNENTLGVIKFMFHNRYGVYLHDTNGKRLFRRSARDLSHGCVRVEKARSLARYLVKDDSIYVTPDDLDQYMEVQRRLELKIVRPIPLFIEYVTSEVRNGKISFYEDIYARDSLLLENLKRREQNSGHPIAAVTGLAD